MTLRLNFLFPFYRELPLLYGICCVSKDSLDWILNRKGTGNAAIIVIGGAQEALDAHPGGDYRLTLASRKGFARVALQNGYELLQDAPSTLNETPYPVIN